MHFSNLWCFILHSRLLWLSTIKTQCLPALLAFNTCMRQNAEGTREDSLPCYCYAIKSSSRTIHTQVPQLTSADRQSSGHEWTANSSLHNPRTAGRWTWFLCTASVIPANKLSMQEINQFNRNYAPNFRFTSNSWFLIPISKRRGEWPFWPACGRPCHFSRNKRPVLFLKAQFQTYVVFSYL